MPECKFSVVLQIFGWRVARRDVCFPLIGTVKPTLLAHWTVDTQDRGVTTLTVHGITAHHAKVVLDSLNDAFICEIVKL